MAQKKVSFMCTAFRDGFQSVYGARVLTEDFMPAVAAAREAGITYFEAGGGAMFQSPYFYCNEDAFHMMDRFREVAGPDANLQTLARGVNLVCLDSASSDVIRLHAKLFKKHGITTIRNFDALNDVNNLIFSGRCIHEAGLKHQVVVTMMALPPGCTGAHDPDFYEKTLRSILDAGIPFDSVCFKDASGTSVPAYVHETVKRARKMLPAGTRIQYHTHETAGCGVTAYKAALDAGADTIDLSLSPVSGGTCQPDVIVMWHALRGSGYDLGVDIDKVREAEKVFCDCMKDYFLPPEATKVEPMIPWSPMPGGALTANTQMLRDNNLMDRYNDMIAAMSEVVRRGGFGTSVTPVSQFYFQQAFNNVLQGPWKKIAPGYGKMVLGYFGRTPVEPDPEIVRIASEQLGLPPTTKTVLEINDADPKKSLDTFRKMLTDKGLPLTEENLFIAAACQEKGILFLEGKAQLGIRKNIPAKAAPAAGGPKPAGYTVTINGKAFAVELKGGKALVNGKEYDVKVADGLAAAPAAAAGKETEVKASVPGVILRLSVSEGVTVAEGDELLVMDVMKMETPVASPCAGTVKAIHVAQTDKVNTGDVLVLIG
ncbi:MAG: biotin/lipoyl-containing protein [Kiritimatiellia bacterium]|nr:biotin/lipoyl-containing protein [Kiritimatiellia bacterium]